jgi:hypothetical protein
MTCPLSLSERVELSTIVGLQLGARSSMIYIMAAIISKLIKDGDMKIPSQGSITNVGGH